MFEGTITISPNPLATIGTLGAKTYSPVYIPGKEGYRGFTKEDRADGNFWRAQFILTGGINFLKHTMNTNLSKMVLIHDEERQPLWEGFIYEMEINTGVAIYRISLAETWNRVWMRYRITGAAEPTISTPLEDLISQAQFGIKEYVMTGGELENTDVADQPVQRFLDEYRIPKKAPVSLGLAGRRVEAMVKGVTDRPHILARCRGYDDTLNWQVYEHDVAGNQNSNAQIQDVLDAKAQFVASYKLDANSTLVSTKYQTNRRSGDIIKDIARVGDGLYQRWIPWWNFGRQFEYKRAAIARLVA